MERKHKQLNSNLQNLFGSEKFPELAVHWSHTQVLAPIYYSYYFMTYYRRWDYISLDHPACSVETFQKTVQRAAKPFRIQQNTEPEECSHAVSQQKELYQYVVNDFHIHTEVSSVEWGNHLHFARQVFYRAVRTAWACACAWYIPIVPLNCSWTKGWMNRWCLPCCGKQQS